MTRLLVSVRSLEEAREAFSAGAHLIDLKEPTAGSLGRVRDDVAHSVAHDLGRRITLSMALGELADWNGSGHLPVPPGITYVKLGLAGCAAIDDWPLRWRRVAGTLPEGCRPVAVAYADWRDVHSPPPDIVLSHAVPLGCGGLLIDTCQKASGSVFDHWTARDVAQFLDRAAKLGLVTVLAGSLNLDIIEVALGCSPDFLAVRGAVCDGTRESALVGGKVRQWVKQTERSKR